MIQSQIISAIFPVAQEICKCWHLQKKAAGGRERGVTVCDRTTRTWISAHNILTANITSSWHACLYWIWKLCIPRDIFCMLNEAWGESVSSAQLSQWPWATLGRRSLAQQLASSITGILHLPRSFFYYMKPWQINAIKSNVPPENKWRSCCKLYGNQEVVAW